MYHVYNDTASGVVWVFNQVSLGGGETVMENLRLRNGFEIRQQLRLGISMGIMGSSLQIYFKTIARRWVNLIVFLMLERSIKIINLIALFKIF